MNKTYIEKKYIFLNSIICFAIALDGKWETFSKSHTKKHLIVLDRIYNERGIKGWTIVIWKYKLTFGNKNQ